jgi:hypothetical protein
MLGCNNIARFPVDAGLEGIYYYYYYYIVKNK